MNKVIKSTGVPNPDNGVQNNPFRNNLFENLSAVGNEEAETVTPTFSKSSGVVEKSPQNEKYI